MLMTAKRKKLRERFGLLLANVQRQRARNRDRALAGGDGGAEDGGAEDGGPGRTAAAAAAAGPLGRLPPDLVCAILQHLAALAPTLRCGVELREAAAQSVVQVHRALESCAYLWRSFVEDGAVLRLELAARGCTSLMPTNAASLTPYFDQVMREERSRFDLRMLESALNALVCHCAGEHCRGVRRAHNESIATPRKKGAAARPPTPLLETVLAGRRPRVKVVWPSGVLRLAAGAAVNECLLSLRPPTHQRDAAGTAAQRSSAYQTGWGVAGRVAAGSLVGLKDESPEMFNPNTELQLIRRLEVGTAIVEQIASSPCGQWIALVKEPLEADGATRTEHQTSALELWHCGNRNGSGAAPRLCGSLSSAGVHVHQMWFAVGQPYSLCFVAYHADARQPNNSIQHDPSARSRWHRNGIYQFGVINEFADVCARTERGACFMRSNPNDHSVDAPSLRPTSNVELIPEDDRFYFPEVLESGDGLAYSNLIQVAVAASGRCVAAVVMGNALKPKTSGSPGSWTVEAASQVVFYECPSACDNTTTPDDPDDPDGVDPFLAIENRNVEPITSLLFETDHGFPAPKVVKLSPCGDVAVVMMQAVNSEFFVQVHLRVSPTTGFTMARRLRLEDALQGPLSSMKPRAGARRHVRTAPSASVFSPCGRFLLLAFAFNEDNVMAAMRSCKPGLCVFDLSDAWVHHRQSLGPKGVPIQERCDVAWIECRADLLPQEMAWNAAGLWLLARGGVLLLGL